MKTLAFSNYYVFYEKNNEVFNNCIIIYFDHAGNRSSENIEISEQIAAIRIEPTIVKITHLCERVYCIVPKICNWYQCPDIYNILDLIKNENPSKRFILYGMSMGGFAAINYSSYINGEFISFQPQYKIDYDVPLIPFYQKCLKNIIKIFTISNIENDKCTNQKGYIFYDPCTDVDLFHVRMISQKTLAQLIEVPFAGHTVSAEINKFYKLYNIVKDVTENKFDFYKFREKITRDLIETFPKYTDYKLKLVVEQYNRCINNAKLSKLRIIKLLYDNKLFFQVTKISDELIKYKGVILNHESIKYILHSCIMSRRFYDFNSYLNYCKKNLPPPSSDPDALVCILVAEALYYMNTNLNNKLIELFENKLSKVNSNYLYFTYHFPIIKRRYIQIRSN